MMKSDMNKQIEMNNNWTLRGENVTTTLLTRDYDFAGEPPAFLVDGVVHRSVTLVYGQTCSGKSTLAASLAAHLANGAGEFLGRTIANGGEPMTVGIIAGDPLARPEYADQLVTSGAIGDGKVYLSEPDLPVRAAAWAEVREQAADLGWQFVIVDNLSSFVPGSLNSDDDVRSFYGELSDFPRRDVPVLVVAHTSDHAGERGYSRIPMGSSLIRFGPRWWCYARRGGGRLTLEFGGNAGAPHSIVVTEPDGTPYFEVLDAAGSDELAERRRSRARRTLDQRAEIGRYIADHCQGMSNSAAARAVAEQFDLNPETVRSYISKGVYPVPA